MKLFGRRLPAWSMRPVFSAVLLLGLLVAVWPGVVKMTGSTVAARAAAKTAVKKTAVKKSAGGRPVGSANDPARVMGVSRAECQQCHSSEVEAWQKSTHFRSDELLFTANAKKYAAALGIPAERLRTDSVCLNCHGTLQATAHGTLHAVSGVSCESCHGAAGGEDGWLNRHHAYGSIEFTHEDETPAHRAERLAACEAAGMVRPADLYQLAKNCFRCHIVGLEELVAAGHKASTLSFEFCSWSGGEVRHNFFARTEQNAEAPTLWMGTTGGTVAQRQRMKYVVGLLVDLEMSFRSRAHAQTAVYASQMGARIGVLNGKLEALASVRGLPEVQRLLDQAFPRVFAIRTDDEEFFTGLADRVADETQRFIAEHDGSDLEIVDPLLPKPHFGALYR